MDNTDSLAKRYLGLDIGDSYTKLSFAQYDENGNVMDPAAIDFGNRVFMAYSAATHGKDWLAIKNLDDITKNLTILPPPSANLYLKSDFFRNSGDASLALEVLLEHVFSAYNKKFPHAKLNPDDFLLAVGVSQPEHEQRLADFVKKSGFKIATYNDSIAAITYLFFKGELSYKVGAHTWLVVDAGSQDLRFILVRKPASGQKLQAELIASVPWGGAQIDEALYNNYFVPSYLSAEKIDEGYKPFALLLLRNLKERLSAQINKGGTQASMSFHFLTVEDPIELTRDKFESQDVCRFAMDEFQKLLQSDILLNHPSLQKIEHVIVIGGNANWYFVRQAIQEKWGADKVHFPLEPELVVAKGLPLLLMGYEPKEVAEPKTQPRPEPVPQPIPPPPPPPPSHTPFPSLEEKLNSYHKLSRSLILKCIIAGAIFAFVVAPVPCAAWPVLTCIEAYMLIQIVKFYGYKLEPDLIGGIVVLLLAVSFVLSIAIGEIVSTLLLFVGAFVVKPLVAGCVIWGLGESAIYLLDQQKRK